MRRQVSARLWAGALAALLALPLPGVAATYGPVSRQEVLSVIAQRIKPDPTRASIWQTALALYRANPQAFVGGDIHRLRPGSVLTVPPPEDIRAIDPEFARAFARNPGRDLSAFLAGREGFLVTPRQAADTAPPEPQPSLRARRAAAEEARPPETGVDAAEPEAAGTATPPTAATPLPPVRLRASPFDFSTEPPPMPRRRPGERARTAPIEEPATDPNRAGALRPVAPPPQAWNPQLWEKTPVPDRWRLLNNLGLVAQRWYDPYNQNTWKGDKPIRDGDKFISLSAIWDTVLEPRRLPTPVGPPATAVPGSVGIFGGSEQFLYNQNLILSLIYLRGDTTFRPPDYEYRFTPVFNYNYTRAEVRRLLDIDVREGTTRSDGHVGVQELFADYHLRNVSERYDFDSIRIGIQPFSSDFRGFLFQDNQLMVRLFGTRDNNLWQYNLVYMRRLEKDTNSGLNAIERKLRNDDTYVANVYRQDFPVLGFVSQLTAAHNRNRDERSFYDDNGFIARPASLGNEKPRRYEVTYLGYNGDGHFGRLNLTVSGYFAFGEQSRGVFLDAPRDILAGFAAGEASFDQDWIRWRLSALWASGENDPYDDTANGFDAIFENPIFAGADTSFWIRQAVPLVGGGGVALNTRNGVLNNLRTSKEHGQSNFDNPGVVLIGAGADFDLTPQLRLSNNFNHLWFADTAAVQAARNQGNLDAEIGWDLSAALIWRPLFTQNIVLRLSGSVLVPGAGFRDLYPDQEAYSVLGNFIFTY